MKSFKMRNLCILSYLIFHHLSCTNDNRKSTSGTTYDSLTIDLVLSDLPERTRNHVMNVDENGSVQKLFAILKNNSNDTIRIWQNDCSWGYSNFQVDFEFDGQQYTSMPLQECWDSNWPRVQLICPKESFITQLKLRPQMKVCDGGWKNSPVLIFKNRKPDKPEDKIKIKARFEIPESEYALEKKVWTGTIYSSEKEYIIYNQFL